MDTQAIDRLLWGAALGAAGLLVFFSLGPPPSDAVVWGSDKVMHASGYAVTIFLFLIAAVWRPGRGYGAFPRAALGVAATAVAASMVIEILQVNFFSRQGDVLDVLANTTGAAVALGAWLAMRFGAETR